MSSTTEAITHADGDTYLSAEQLGHIRHIDNLSRQWPNDWSFMQNKDTGQFDFGGYRFQLSYMAYALALAHVHRLPNAPGVFKPVFERLIEKLLMPEVWQYWRDVSRGGAVFNAHLADKYQEEWNPVGRDNIMYSAYVQSLASMYHHLFDDDRYTRPGALSFSYWSFFWGGEPKVFDYDEHSLTEHVYWQLAETGYIGVACEPNCAFQICNQPAILGFRMHDLVTGGQMAAEVTESYEKAWSDLGRLDSAGHYNLMRLQDSGAMLPNATTAAWVDAWCGTLMNMWNRDFVRSNYPRQIKDLIEKGPDGLISVKQSRPREAMGQIATNDTCDFGWVATWASEMGDTELLEGLLRHADRYMNPTWRDGGLYYPRNDDERDQEGNRTRVEPLTGNALLAYARLNVPDGLWKLYNQPWSRSHFTEPALTAVSADISVSQAHFDSPKSTLMFRIQRHGDRGGDGTVFVSFGRDAQSWSLREGNSEVACAAPRGSSMASEQQTSCTVREDNRGFELRSSPGEPRTYELQIQR